MIKLSVTGTALGKVAEEEADLGREGDLVRERAAGSRSQGAAPDEATDSLVVGSAYGADPEYWSTGET